MNPEAFTHLLLLLLTLVNFFKQLLGYVFFLKFEIMIRLANNKIYIHIIILLPWPSSFVEQKRLMSIKKKVKKIFVTNFYKNFIFLHLIFLHLSLSIVHVFKIKFKSVWWTLKFIDKNENSLIEILEWSNIFFFILHRMPLGKIL